MAVVAACTPCLLTTAAKVGAVTAGALGLRQLSKKRKRVKKTKTKTKKNKQKGGRSCKRKAPSVQAKKYALGTVKKGMDGNKWVVTTYGKGLKRWKRKV